MCVCSLTDVPRWNAISRQLMKLLTNRPEGRRGHFSGLLSPMCQALTSQTFVLTSPSPVMSWCRLDNVLAGCVALNFGNAVLKFWHAGHSEHVLNKWPDIWDDFNDFCWFFQKVNWIKINKNNLKIVKKCGKIRERLLEILRNFWNFLKLIFGFLLIF